MGIAYLTTNRAALLRRLELIVMWLIILGLIFLCVGAVGLVTAGPYDKPMTAADYVSFFALLIGLGVFAWIGGQAT